MHKKTKNQIYICKVKFFLSRYFNIMDGRIVEIVNCNCAHIIKEILIYQSVQCIIRAALYIICKSAWQCAYAFLTASMKEHLNILDI